MKISVRAMVYMALVAGIYAAITISQSAIGFGPIQFRIAESLNLLAFFNPIFVPAVTIGVFLSNLIGSPYGIIDAGLGTLATVIALILIRITKKTTNNLFIASLWPTVVNALIVPIIVLVPTVGIAGITWGSYLIFAGLVAIGQFVVVTLFGFTLFYFLQQKHPRFIEHIKSI